MATPTIHGQDLGLLRASDLLPVLSPLLDENTGIAPSQRVDGAFPLFNGTIWRWSDWESPIFTFDATTPTFDALSPTMDSE